MRMTTKFSLWIIFPIIFLGCGGPYYFDINIESPAFHGDFKLDKTLLVEDVETNHTYRDSRIVYRESQFKVKYSGFKFWAKSPDDLIEATVILFWRGSGIFKKVSGYYSRGESDWIMRIQLDAIEMRHIQKKWIARLALDIEIVDSDNEKTILVHSFDRNKELRGKNFEDLPKKISQILHEELLKIAAKLQEMTEG